MNGTKLNREIRATLAFVLIFGFTACTTTKTVVVSPERCAVGKNPTTDGAYLRTDDGVELWYKKAGNPKGPVVIYLHGGPGYNSYAFEKAAGALLEQRLQMVYLDQRGCGRSWFEGHPEKLGIGPTIEDIERLRKKLGAPQISLIAHSFGGLMALEYVKAHPYQD